MVVRFKQDKDAKRPLNNNYKNNSNICLTVLSPFICYEHVYYKHTYTEKKQL